MFTRLDKKPSFIKLKDGNIIKVVNETTIYYFFVGDDLYLRYYHKYYSGTLDHWLECKNWKQYSRYDMFYWLFTNIDDEQYRINTDELLNMLYKGSGFTTPILRDLN